MSLLFPGTPVVPPAQDSLLDHVSRHFFNRGERWFSLGEMALTLAWAAAYRGLKAEGWAPGTSVRNVLPDTWRGLLTEFAPGYVALAIESVDEAIAAQRVFPSEPAGGSVEPRLSYVGRRGIFVVAPAVGRERPFYTAFRVCSPARLTRRKLDDDATFFARAKEQAQKRLPRDFARWEARAVRRQQRLASTSSNPSGAGRPGERNE